MVPNKVVKAKVKVKEKPYYKMVGAPTKLERDRMDEMAADLAKEDFYGYKKMEERMKKDAKEAINRRIVEERTKQTRDALKKNPKGVIFKSVEIKKK